MKVALFFLGLALLGGAGWAQEPAPLTGEHRNLACDDCHSGEALADCRECHDEAVNIHPVDVRPTISIPEGFALDPAGVLLCRTCHQLHGGDAANAFLNLAGGQITDRTAFCANCHGESLARANPHHATESTNRCAFCHATIPASAEEAAGTARLDIVKLCDFCHGALAKDHPRNIDPSLKLPTGLPRSPDGSWNCVTCHNPHGTKATTHYVRPEFARHFERGRQENPHVESYFACQACHSTSMPDEIRAPDYALRYKGDINVLCISCHITERGHHPTGLPLPPMILEDVRASELPLPLGEDARIDCYTCHDNSCDTGHQRMRVRHYDRVKLKSDLCWVCHRRDEFSRVNPHVEEERFCVHCHESQPIPGISRGLMTVPKMVCLRCHQVNPHPASADHLKVPSGKIRPDESLPLEPGGEVTCITCHDPHGSGASLPKRLRAEPADMCGLCHWR